MNNNNVYNNLNTFTVDNTKAGYKSSTSRRVSTGHKFVFNTPSTQALEKEIAQSIVDILVSISLH